MEPIAYKIRTGTDTTALATTSDRIIVATTEEEARRMADLAPRWTPVPLRTITVTEWEAEVNAR